MSMIAAIALFIAAIVALVLLAFVANFFSLWLQALFSRASVSMFQLIGMRLRKVPPKVIVQGRHAGRYEPPRSSLYVGW